MCAWQGLVLMCTKINLFIYFCCMLLLLNNSYIFIQLLYVKYSSLFYNFSDIIIILVKTIIYNYLCITTRYEGETTVDPLILIFYRTKHIT